MNDEITIDEGYPAGWLHCLIHFNDTTGEMHSDGDHVLRHKFESWRALLAAKDAEIAAKDQRIADLETFLRASEKSVAEAEGEIAALKETVEGLDDGYSFETQKRNEAEAEVSRLREENERLRRVCLAEAAEARGGENKQ